MTTARVARPGPAAEPARPPPRMRRVQPALRVSTPHDPAEREAASVARRVMTMAPPPVALRVAPAPARAPERPADDASGARRVSETDLAAASSGGALLPDGLRHFMEQRFRADFKAVRVHTGGDAARLATRMQARAFAYGNHLFFGPGQYAPESQAGAELIAHELTHTIQQGAVLQPAAGAAAPAPAPVRQAVPRQVQRLGLSDVLDYLADKANYIPGFRMFTIVLGVNPVNMSRVDRSAANILRALVEFIPGGALIVQALDAYGVFDKAGGYIDDQIRTLGLSGAAIRAAIDRFIDSLGLSDLFHPGDVWDRAKRIFTEPIDKLLTLARNVGGAILGFIRDAILKPLAKLAEGTRGWDLLIAVLGRNPITGEAVPRTADTLIGGFMKLIGQEEVWENLKKSNAVARAWTWFQGTLAGVIAFVQGLPERFLALLRSLEIADLVILPRVFTKVGAAFGGFVGDFIGWAGRQVLSLLEIIFDVVAPAVMPYLRKAAAAFQTIIKDPIRFIGHLIRAGVQGFKQFAANFVSHLKKSLIDWLTGTLAGANLYIPQAFTLVEIVKFILSVLGLTWQNIRGKLVKVIGEPAMAALETAFDIVVTLVKEGPAAAWQKIVEAAGNLRDMVMDQVMAFVRDSIVQAAITKLVTSLNPAGAFIQAVIAIYNTVMFFIERLKQIGQVAAAFIDAIAAIAAGVIQPAAERVERTMGGLLTLVISFLARLVGLGKVSDAVTNIVNKIRAPIDKALDKVVDWIVATAKKVGKLVASGAKAGGGAAGTTGEAAAADKVSAQMAMNGVSHTIEAVAAGGRVSLFMASRREPLHDRLAREAATWSAATDPEIRSNGQALAARLATVRKREDTLIATYAAASDNAQRHALATNGVNEIGAALVAIAGEFGITLEDEDVPRATSFQSSGLDGGRAKRAYVDPLTVVSLRPRQAAFQFAPGGFLGFPGRSSYAAGHLVADTFGGGNEPANLALMSGGTNGRFSSIEAKVRNALRGTKKIPEPRTVLRYEVSAQFEDNPAGQLDGWMKASYQAQIPEARFDGAGAAIMAMVAAGGWNDRAIDRQLGLAAPRALAFYDRVKWKTAKLYLSKGFTISIRTYTGKAVDGDSFPNHVGGMADPP